jgi:cytochrome c biogenesis protein CcmG, thiol:disulfide interchange protein DsbE
LSFKIPVANNKILGATVAILVLLGAYFVRQRLRHDGSQRPLVHGRLAPDFSLLQLDGRPLQLSAYRGKVVLLDFWATWCDPCRDEIPRFVDLENKYGPQGLQIIGVSMDDSPDPVRDFSQRVKMNYPVVMGNAEIGQLYGGVLGLPIVFLVGRDDRIHAKYVGAMDSSVLEKEIVTLLQSQSGCSGPSACMGKHGAADISYWSG